LAEGSSISVVFRNLKNKELITLDWRRVKQDEEGLMLQVIAKSDNKHYVPVFLPKLGGENGAICPVAALSALPTSALAVSSEIGMIFTDYLRERVLSKQTISMAIKEVLGRIGIDTEVYGPYTIKHAVISALVKDGMPLVNIRAAAHYKSAETMRYYSYKEIMKRVGLSLARIVQRVKITEFVDPSKEEEVEKFRKEEASKY
jgi:site-specific recombinase XerD